VNSQPYNIGVSQSNLSTQIRRYIPFSARRFDGRTNEIRFNTYNRVALLVTGTFQLVLEPTSFGWPNNTPMTDFTVALEFKQRNMNTSADQINTSTWAGGNVTYTQYVANAAFPFYTEINTVTNIVADSLTTTTQSINSGSSILKTIQFSKKFDHYDPRSSDDAFWSGNQTNNSIEVTATVAGLTGSVLIGQYNVAYKATRIEYTQGEAPGSGYFTF
jgi:hypothetical protein